MDRRIDEAYEAINELSQGTARRSPQLRCSSECANGLENGLVFCGALLACFRGLGRSFSNLTIATELEPGLPWSLKILRGCVVGGRQLRLALSITWWWSAFADVGAQPATRILESDDDLIHDPVEGVPPDLAGGLHTAKSGGDWGLHSREEKFQLSFACHHQFPTWPRRLHCVELTGQLPRERHLLLSFYVSEVCLSSLFGFDMRGRAGDFGVSEVVRCRATR